MSADRTPEQPRGLEPGQPVPPDITGRGRERFDWKYALTVVGGLGVIIGTLAVGISLYHIILPPVSPSEMVTRAAVIGIPMMTAIAFESIVFDKLISKSS